MEGMVYELAPCQCAWAYNDLVELPFWSGDGDDDDGGGEV